MPVTDWLTECTTRLAAWAVPEMSVSGRIASSCGGRLARTPGVSTSRSVPATAAAICLSVSSSAATSSTGGSPSGIRASISSTPTGRP